MDERPVRHREINLTTQYTNNKHPLPGGIRKHYLSRRGAKDVKFTRRESWDRHSTYTSLVITDKQVRFNVRF
jgi:hypothetical protein